MQAHDTFVSASDPLRNYYESPLLALRKWDDPAGAQYAFVKFARPFPLGAKITRAVLAFETSAMGSGSHTLNLARISDPLLYQRVNYNNRPGILASSQQSQTKKGALPAGQRWEFDVLADMQAVSAGAEWWGWRITTTDEERRWIYAQESPYSSVEPPTLLVEWADNPARPLNLSPNDGAVGTGKPALSFDYIDVSGSTTLRKARIQINHGSPTFSSPTWDSGELDEFDSVVYLSGTTYPGTPEGEDAYWRIKVMDGDGLALSKRRITLSTSGVVPMMARAGEEIGVNLAVSLHAVTKEVRDEIVPLNRKYGIPELLEACAAYPGANNARRITFEYVMLKGKNDRDEDAHELVRLIKQYRLPAKVNLIPWNPWPGAAYETSDEAQVQRFSDIVYRAGISAPVRRPRGRDIMAACGQLKSDSVKLSRAELDRLAEEKQAAL